jgi:DNA polymerase I-like protein with 3'-5' exonuclease and polymerase domains
MIVRQKEAINQVLNMLKSSLYWSYDIETTGLNVHKDKIIGFGCCNPLNISEKFYIITKEWINGELITVLEKEAVLPVLNQLKTKRLLTYNGSFDTRFTYHYYNIDLIESIYSDIMLLIHTTDENRISYKLKDVAADTFGNEAKIEQKDMFESIKANGGTEKEYYKADSTLMAKYGIQDNILTCKLYNHYNKILNSEGLFDFFYNEEVMPLYRLVTIPMELKGVPLDMNLMTSTLEEIKLDLNRLQEDIQTAIAPHLDDFNRWYLNKEYPGTQLSGQFLEALCSIIAPSDWPKTKAGTHSFSKVAFKKKPHLFETDLWKYYDAQMRLPAELTDQVRLKLFQDTGEKYMFNILSKDHLKRLFFTKLKETPTSTTDKGSPQVEDDFLIAMSEKYEWVRWLRTYNKLTKIKSTYIESYLEKQNNGIFYPSYFQHRTVSGRYGSNLQQLSRPMEQGQAEEIVVKYNNRIRKFFIAGDGHKIIGTDYSSLEPMVFSHVSNDEGLRGIFRNGLDFYSLIAIQTEELHEFSADKKASNYLGKLNKQARQRAKAYCLSVPYGSTPFALGMTLGVSTQVAEGLYNKYLNAFPDLKKWMKDTVVEVVSNGKVRTETGRIRRFPELKQLMEKYKGVDMTNQLEIWKAFNEQHNTYKIAKEDGKKIRNFINNSRNIKIQGLAASIINRASIAIAKRLKNIEGAYIFANVHDENLVRCLEKDVPEVSSIIQDCMENTYKISVDLIAEPSIGNNIYEAK